jgi:hypothetical protein
MGALGICILCRHILTSLSARLTALLQHASNFVLKFAHLNLLMNGMPGSFVHLLRYSTNPLYPKQGKCALTSTFHPLHTHSWVCCLSYIHFRTSYVPHRESFVFWLTYMQELDSLLIEKYLVWKQVGCTQKFYWFCKGFRSIDLGLTYAIMPGPVRQ